MLKNRFLFVIAGIAVLAFLAGCSLFGTDDALVIGGGYINGYVETQDGGPLAGVTVNYSIPDEPVTEEEGEVEAASYSTKGTQAVVTDAAGFFEINALIPGNYRLTFTIADYTIGTDMVSLTPEGFFVISDTTMGSEADGEAPMYEYTDELIVTLFAKIATASGNVYIETATGTAPATGQVVVAMFQDRYFSPAKVDASGNFSFLGLPAGEVGFYVQAFYTAEGVFYENFWLTTYEVTDPVTEFVTVYNGTADLSDRNEALEPHVWAASDGTTPFVTLSNLSQSFDVTFSVDLTFNKAINPSAADFELWENAEYISTGNPLDILVTWSTTTGVTIDPDEVLFSDTVYIIVYDVEATDGYTASVALPLFRTERGIMKIGSNVEELDDVQYADFPVASNIELYFNADISHIFESEVVLIDITDGTTNPEIDIAIDITTDTTILSITPTDSLQEDHTYSLTWTVYSALDNSTDSASSTIPGPIVFSTVAPVLTAPTGAPATLSRVTPPANLDHNSTSVTIEWTRMSNVSGYQILAFTADEATLTTPIVEKTIIAEVADPGPTDYATTLQTTIDLSDPTFDAWPYELDLDGSGAIDGAEFINLFGDVTYEPLLGDLTATLPLSNNTYVRVTVRAYNGDGTDKEVSTTESTILDLSDEAGPALAASQTGITNTFPVGVTAGISGPYYKTFLIDEAISNTSYTITGLVNDTGGTMTLGGSTINAYSIDAQTVELEITVGTGEDLSSGLGLSSVDISVTDTSGNPAPVTLTF